VLRVVDLLGRSVFVRELGSLPVGAHSLDWNGRQMNGTKAPAGAYVVSIQSSYGDMLGHRVAQLMR
jgi:flagellar hook assembly protein FlgD